MKTKQAKSACLPTIKVRQAIEMKTEEIKIVRKNKKEK